MVTKDLYTAGITPSIRPAVPADAARLAEIHVFGWRAAYQEFISEEYLFTTLSVHKRIASFTKALEDAGAANRREETWVAVRGPVVMGFMTIGNCRDEDRPEAFELMGLYIDPLLRRRGSGSALAAHCEVLALARGFKELLLWVLADNQPARRFYEHAGYHIEGKSQLLEKFGLEELRYVKRL